MNRPPVALVTVVDAGSERLFSRTFAESPIRIGRHRASDLQLCHPEIARWHGEICFQAGWACFRNRAWSKRTSVDQWRLARGEAVWLAEDSVIALGPFRIDVSLCKPRMRDAERSRKVTPLVLLPGLPAPPPHTDRVLASFLRLARMDAVRDLDRREDGAPPVPFG